MKKARTEAEIRNILVRRLTKGAAFMEGDYSKLLAETRAELDRLSKAEMMEKYADYLWDVK